MLHMLKMTFILVFVLSFTACQPLSTVQAKRAALAEKLKNAKQLVKQLEQELAEKTREEASNKVSEVESEKKQIQEALLHAENLAKELARIIKLPETVARGEATPEQLLECQKVYDEACPQDPNTWIYEEDILWPGYRPPPPS